MRLRLSSAIMPKSAIGPWIVRLCERMRLRPKCQNTCFCRIRSSLNLQTRLFPPRTDHLNLRSPARWAILLFSLSFLFNTMHPGAADTVQVSNLSLAIIREYREFVCLFIYFKHSLLMIMHCRRLFDHPLQTRTTPHFYL
jgi:hypothetical protein